MGKHFSKPIGPTGVPYGWTCRRTEKWTQETFKEWVRTLHPPKSELKSRNVRHCLGSWLEKRRRLARTLSSFPRHGFLSETVAKEWIILQPVVLRRKVLDIVPYHGKNCGRLYLHCS